MKLNVFYYFLLRTLFIILSGTVDVDHFEQQRRIIKSLVALFNVETLTNLFQP